MRPTKINIDDFKMTGGPSPIVTATDSIDEKVETLVRQGYDAAQITALLFQTHSYEVTQNNQYRRFERMVGDLVDRHKRTPNDATENEV